MSSKIDVGKLMKRILHISLLFLSLYAAACGARETAHSEHDPQHGATQAEVAKDTTLAKAGPTAIVYSGILPCTDCEGVETTLSLRSDYTYQLHELYIARKSTGPGSNELSGEGKWMLHGQDTIHLHGVKDRPSLYIRSDSNLTQLDAKGRRVAGAGAARYILKKIN